MKKEMLLQTFYCKHFFNKIAVQIERRLSKPKTSLLISSKLHMQFQWLHKMFVFTAWHKIKKFSCQKFIHNFLSWVIQLLKGVATPATPNFTEVLEKNLGVP